MITKSIISRQPNGNISITGVDEKDNLNVIIAKHVLSQGNILIEVVDGIVERPAERINRDCWDFDIATKKVVVDSGKVDVKVAAINAKETKRQEILSTLKISEQDLADLIEG